MTGFGLIPQGQKTLALAAMALSLVACDSQVGRWVGAEKDKPVVTGKRIPVLVDEQRLAPNDSVSGEQVALPEPKAGSDWPQSGGNPAHVPPHAALAEKVKSVWSVDIGAGTSRSLEILATPVAAGGKVYAMDAAGMVTALDAAKGKRVWQRDTAPDEEDKKAIGGGLALSGERLLASTGFGEVLALSVADGSVIWRRQIGQPLRAAPIVAEDRVIVIDITNRSHVLNLSDGTVQWTHRGMTEATALLGGATPAAENQVIVVPYSSGEVFALRAETGRVIWSDNIAVAARVGALPGLADIRAMPVIEGKHVLALSHSGRLVAFDLNAGQRVWEQSVGGSQTPVVAGQAVFVLSAKGQLAELARATGLVRWVKDLPACAKDEEDEKECDEALHWSGPVLAGWRLWLTNSAGELVEVTTEDGTITKRHHLSDASYLPPIVAEGTIYVLSQDGTLTAFR
ncbi:MAG: PQQ-binding-like beta-propeller repeat protein [Alphaproteobacteria bacterium]|nr:MAG: PQQ-binding-like beta-propeller repeat protein [Alphaproteobacteria bacterium]